MATIIAIFLSSISKGLSTSVYMEKASWKAILFLDYNFSIAFCMVIASVERLESSKFLSVLLSY
ncbi:MAG: hypothetical protein QFX38_07310 [Methanothermobacter sp.]|nr:hypothetical protein [Methanothermobacter sp.]